MKSLFLLLFSCLLSLQVHSQEYSVNFAIGGINPTNPSPSTPHAPALFPQASLNGHTLTIDVSADAEMLQLCQNNTVVYQTVIIGNGQIVQFPDLIIGECELILLAPTYIFSAVINL